jgi:hypothetical protein
VLPVSDAFLLGIAEISATVIGLFLVAVFFHVESSLRRSIDPVRDVVQPYMRAGTRLVVLLFVMPLVLSISLIAFELVWSRVLFALLSVAIVTANVATAARIRTVARATGSMTLVVNEVVGTVLVLVVVALPWALGGIRPTREELTPALLMALAAGFLSVGVVAVSAFDVARGSDVALTGEANRRRRPRRGAR